MLLIAGESVVEEEGVSISGHAVAYSRTLYSRNQMLIPSTGVIWDKDGQIGTNWGTQLMPDEIWSTCLSRPDPSHTTPAVGNPKTLRLKLGLK